MLESSLMPMMYDILHLPLSHSSLDQHFNHLVSATSEVIEKHAPLQTASRKQKKMQNKPCLTKSLLRSIKNKQILYKKFFLSNNKFGKWYYKKYANKFVLEYTKLQFLILRFNTLKSQENLNKVKLTKF